MDNLKDIEEAPTALSILLEAAKKNIANANHKNMPTVIEPVRFNQSYIPPIAVGEIEIDMKKMIKNAKARRGDNNGN